MSRSAGPHRIYGTIVAVIVLLAVVSSCSVTRHVPDGQMLLDRVRIDVDDAKQHPDVQTAELVNYLRQNENHRVLGGLKLQLAIYNMSGHDTASWFNRWIQRVGSAPVIYDSTLTAASAAQLHMALNNKGYMNNRVSYHVQADSAHKKARVNYNITLGDPYYIRSIAYDINDPALERIVLADTATAPVHEGSLLDHNRLDEWRTEITRRMRNEGYYAFNKEYVTFMADTAAGSRAVDITLATMPPYDNDRMPYYKQHRPFRVRQVTFVTSYDPVTMHDGNYYGRDTVEIKGVRIFYGDDRYLRSKVIAECNYIEPGGRYCSDDIDRTYRALSRLGIVKFVNIVTQPVGEIDGDLWLDTYVLLQRDKLQSVSFSLEGTNSEGDLGFGVGVDYQHRNLLHGSERFNAKFRMRYESISGDLGGLINNNFSEYAAEVGITFPKFKFPFLSGNFKKKIQASTELATSFDFQKRPEYTRIIAGAAWRYTWTEQQGRMRHRFNLLDLSYVYLPRSKADFLDGITNPLLRYSYEDHFIMRLGYNFYLSNKQTKTSSSPMARTFQRDVYTVRAAAETAGNLLYGISSLTGQNRETDDSYKVFGIRYAQYVKLEGEYAHTHYFDMRNSIAMRVGLGVAVPYGNSTVLPFEKRFYAGGANGVRGWGVRTLGPGSLNASNSQNSFIYQCGDIRFDASVEYRAKLFWVIELGLFVDAGNIWTIRDYEDQPGGVFKFNKFYEQIALAYGLGIRLNFTYFLLRFDLGMKAHNPATGQEHWPLVHPRFKRDSEFHFSVGYPF